MVALNQSRGPGVTLLSLPNELLSKIAALACPSFIDTFGRGDTWPLVQLRLTCRRLDEICAPLFWHTVVLPGQTRRAYGSLGHNEAMAGLLKLRERHEFVRTLWFNVPDGAYLLSAALLGTFSNITSLKAVRLGPWCK